MASLERTEPPLEIPQLHHSTTMQACPRFSHLTLTGGAIGIGPSLSIGAALACPDRLVINLQADGGCRHVSVAQLRLPPAFPTAASTLLHTSSCVGSAMYAVQALWTQARKKLNILTLICDNASYAILKIECARQRLPTAGPATRALTNLGQPSLDWVSLALGMGVPATKVSTCEELARTLEAEIAARHPGGESRGPHLVWCCLPQA
jgi:acetolactate synthase-1/2/3 large subunit